MEQLAGIGAYELVTVDHVTNDHLQQLAILARKFRDRVDSVFEVAFVYSQVLGVIESSKVD